MLQWIILLRTLEQLIFVQVNFEWLIHLLSMNKLVSIGFWSSKVHYDI